jgi:type VI secretion system secreted protein VgrG
MPDIASNAEVLPSAGFPDKDIRLLRFQLFEALSEPFELTMQLSSENRSLDTARAIGKPLAIKITVRDGKERYIHGQIASASLLGSHRAQFFRYEAVVRPALWFLTHTRRSRVFENEDAVSIVKTVLGAASALGVSVDAKGLKGCAKRPYCVQYQESDFDFVSRLLEEEGIYYYFKHYENSHAIVLADGPGAHEPLIASAKMDYRPGPSRASVDEDSVLAWRIRDSVGPAKFALRDFDFERSADVLEEKAEAKSARGPRSLEVEVYPEGYLFDGGNKGNAKEPAGEQAKRFANVLAQQRDASARKIEGATDARAMACGHTFEIAKLPKEEQTGKYLVTYTEIEFRRGLGDREHDDAEASYICAFRALPIDLPFRPAIVTTKPRMFGPHTAMVVGKGEIDPDPYGRVKVRFHWGPSSAQTSCWARVSHPWAGKGFGMVALPRVGEEVVVDFLDGDPDRPLITGRVYNAQNMPPYELPAQKTVTGIRTHSSEGGGAGNFNELRFDDKKGDEYVWLQAEKIFHRWVKLDAFDVVGQDQHVKIARDRTEEVGRDWQVGVAQHFVQTVGGDAQIEIGKDTIVNIGAHLNATVANDLLAKAGGKTELDVGSDMAINVGANTALSAGANFDLKSGANAAIESGAKMDLKAGMAIAISAGMSLTLKAGAGTITLGPAGVTIDGPLVKINSGGGGSAAAAAKKANKAQPKKPKEPVKPTEQKDPIK